MRSLLTFIVCLFVSALALAKPATSDSLKPSAKTDVLNEPNGKSVVGALEPGHSYEVIKRGGPGGTWCKVKAGAKDGWVSCDVGAAVPAPVAPPAKPSSVGNGKGCATTCDHSPLFSKPPELAPLDREVLTMCPARPEASVTASEVRRFVAAHVAGARVQRALSVAGRSGLRESNIDWLTDLWTGKGPRNAFTMPLQRCPPAHVENRNRLHLGSPRVDRGRA